MFGTKFTRQNTATIIALVMGAIVLANPAQATTDAAPSVTFLTKAFGTQKKRVVLYEEFQAGITLESMLQLKAGGRSFINQLPAIQYNLTNASAPIGQNSKGSYNYSGYLFNDDSDKTVKPGLAGKWLFTSQVINVQNDGNRYTVFKKLRSIINSSTGTITYFDDTSGSAVIDQNVFDYAWVALGLNSYKEHTLANKVVKRLIKMQNSDGSFGTDANSYADATGIALLAINYYQNFGSDSDDAKRAAAEKLAVKFLKTVALPASETSTTKNHWNAFDEPSVNATGYAVMGLKASGAADKTLAPYIAWLKSKLSVKGGFKTSFSNGAGDVFATSQALTAALGKSYLDLLPK